MWREEEASSSVASAPGWRGDEEKTSVKGVYFQNVIRSSRLSLRLSIIKNSSRPAISYDRSAFFSCRVVTLRFESRRVVPSRDDSASALPRR